ncbi:MAG: D-sedoheptulose 7-phosphate isomerase [Desulfobacteraceae bacterium]|nr:D-sedoheptulose 7-phosphate isomerase [Desulfobacterales bacterium]MBL6967656.1 D-sedoheptulose 7-phosphate isomerase [Desulfobacteraceae bacterium]MBL7102001.1 D-sedoheptulose 7-phosphate isomerase [Desulfobacteraceae bacterium]MBL7172851.1 D-sedoheptulose 7-phosphate isomerase [Desulfobacteraceae bacterium]
MENIIEEILTSCLKTNEEFITENRSKIASLAEKIASAFLRDRKLLICGNGGSAADAQHMAAEFVNRFQLERPPLPALALTTDTSVITSIGNDYSFEYVFSKQVKALGVEGDILLAISTSGNSKNVVSAVETAHKQGLYTAGLLGSNGGKLSGMVDMALIVRSNVTARVQEAHILAEHMICHLVDYILFQKHLGSE